jgi:hypothetical protein
LRRISQIYSILLDKLTPREIALAFGAPPLLPGLPSFRRQTVIPLVARLQKSFQLWAQPAFESLHFDYNISRIRVLDGSRGRMARRRAPARPGE